MMLDDQAPAAEQIIADLTRERDEALAREAAIAEVLQVINSSPGDLAPVFQTILEKAVRLCEATHGTLRTFNGETFHLVATAYRKALVLPDAGRGPSSLYRRFSDGEQIIHLADVLGSPEYQLNPGVRAGMDAVQARSWLGVSLRKEARLLGVIAILRQELRPFSDEQLALLQSFAAQAVIAMENARLLSETREALEQQTATAEVLGVINSSPGDLAPVFNAILDKAHALCGAASGGLMLIEGNRYRAVAVHGDPNLAEYWLDLGWIPFPTGDDTLFGRLSRGELVHLRDAARDDGTPKSAQYHRLVELAGPRSLVMVPLRKDNVLFGTITAFRKEVQPFSDKQIALLQNFAAQAVIAMENARLLTELQQRTRDLEESLKYQTATSDVLRVISRSTFDLQPVLDTLVATAARLCSADLGLVSSREEDGLRVNATFSTTPEYEAFIRGHLLPLTRGSLAGRACAEGKAVQIPDLTADPEFTITETVTLGKMRAALAVPLMREGEVIGAISLARQRVEPFTERQLELVATFADQAVIAIENTRLITETREALEQQTATAEVLQVINSSPGDLAPVFDAMLEKAIRLCEATHGHLLTFDGEYFHPTAATGELRGVEWSRRIGAFRPHPSVSLGRITRGERVVHIADVRKEEAYLTVPEFREQAELRGIRSQVAVGLLKDNILLGAMVVYRQEVRPFSDKQIALLQNFAAQAVIAMESARLLTETREALEQQTATAEVLQVINSSPGNLAPVFEAMLDKALGLCGASIGVLWTYDGTQLCAEAHRGASPAYADVISNGPYPANATGLTNRFLEGERFAHGDVAAGEGYRSGKTLSRALVDLGGGRTNLAVPLRKDDALLGFIVIYRQEVRPFTEKQIALLQNFAAQAVIAMENARLLTETREALEQQTAMAEVLQVINSSPGDLTPVFDAVLEKALTLCDASFGSVSIGEHFERAVSRGLPAEYLAAVPSVAGPFSPGSLWDRIIGGESVISIPDLAEPEAIRLATRFEPLVRLAGARSFIAVALRKDEQLLGLIAIFRREVRPFTDKQIGLMQNFAAQAVIAVENARLLGELRDRTGDLEEALGYQTATSDVLKVISRSAFDLRPVLTTLVETVARLCEADRGLITTQDGEVYRVVATFAVTPEFDAYLRSLTIVPDRGTVTGRIVLERQVVHIDDIARDPEYAVPVSDFTQGAHTLLGVPLMREDQPVGAIVLARHRVEPFTPRQIELVSTFSDQAVIAIENARLLSETREALEQQTATAEVLEVINSSPGNLSPVFNAILEKALRLCDAVHGHVWSYDGVHINSVAVRGEPRFVQFMDRLGPIPIRPEDTSTSPVRRLLQGERIIHTPDAKELSSYHDNSLYRQIVDISGACTVLSVALRQEDEILGAISLYRRELCLFTDKQISLLQDFAAQAVIAMENARLLDELRQRTEEVAELNRGLEARIAEQVEELGRVGRLKRFLAPQLAELIVSQGDEKILESHRREIVVVFCDLRGYTAFTETAEPEEVLDFLREYHGALGPLVSQFEGTLDQFSGDGIMVFFNDPVPIPDAAERAVKMAIAMREAAGALTTAWRRRGRVLGFGAGIAQGYATLGQIGFADRSGYTAIGTVCNLAARLCAEAKDGQILVGQRVAVAVEETIPLEEVGELTLKGLTQPVVAFNVPAAAAG